MKKVAGITGTKIPVNQQMDVYGKKIMTIVMKKAVGNMMMILMDATLLENASGVKRIGVGVKNLTAGACTLKMIAIMKMII